VPGEEARLRWERSTARVTSPSASIELFTPKHSREIVVFADDLLAARPEYDFVPGMARKAVDRPHLVKTETVSTNGLAHVLPGARLRETKLLYKGNYKAGQLASCRPSEKRAACATRQARRGKDSLG